MKIPLQTFCLLFINYLFIEKNWSLLFVESIGIFRVLKTAKQQYTKRKRIQIYIESGYTVERQQCCLCYMISHTFLSVLNRHLFQYFLAANNIFNEFMQAVLLSFYFNNCSSLSSLFLSLSSVFICLCSVVVSQFRCCFWQFFVVFLLLLIFVWIYSLHFRKQNAKKIK